MVKLKNLIYMLSFLLFSLKVKLKLTAAISDVLLTLKCPNQCNNCLYNADPNNKEFLNEKYFKKIVIGLKKTRCKFISPIGGEPFLYYLDGLEKFINVCKNYSVKIAVFTSCIWATSYEKSFQILNRLKKAGLNHLIISTDIFHQKKVPNEYIIFVLSACKSLTISTCLRVTYTKNFQQTIRPIIELAEKYESKILIEPLSFFGRGHKFNPFDFHFNWEEAHNIQKNVNKYGIKDFIRKNFERLNFFSSCSFGPVIYPNGNIFVSYCSMPKLFIGNIKDAEIEELISKFNKSFMKRNIFIIKYFINNNTNKARIRCDICPFSTN